MAERTRANELLRALGKRHGKRVYFDLLRGERRPLHAKGSDQAAAFRFSSSPNPGTAFEPGALSRPHILSHAYHLFVQSVGHAKTGRVLHVPQRLSPHPTFDQLRLAISQSAHVIYGGTVSNKAVAAFTAVGLAPPRHEEPDCGPHAC